MGDDLAQHGGRLLYEEVAVELEVRGVVHLRVAQHPEDQRAGAGEPAARLADMDIDGVDAEVLYVGGPLQSSDPELRLHSVRGYNRWLSDYASHAPNRLLGMAAIPIDTPERAAEEVHFAAAQTGLAGGYIPLFPPDGDYGDPNTGLGGDRNCCDCTSKR